MMRNESLNNTPKRFSPSPDDFAVKRRKGLRETVKQLQGEHPEVLGLTLYGSLIKTRSEEEAIRLRESADKARHRPDSDIDGFLIVDAKEVERLTGDANVVEFEHTEGNITNAHFRRDIREQYLGDIRRALQKRLPDLSDEQVGSIYIIPVSEEIIDTLLAAWEKAIEGRSPFQPSLEARREARVSPHLYHLFFLAVEHGVEKYRKYILDRLSALGEKGENMWLELITLVEMTEQDSTLDPNRRYPRILTEAYKVYG